ncbi:MAG: acetate--CoA ligase family protein, partial [Acetobacterales bacterium]
MSQDVSARIAAARNAGRLSLAESEGKRILQHYGIAVPRFLDVAAGGSAATAFSQLEAPLVLKGVATELVHKSDAGAVALGLKSLDEVEAAMGDMTRSVRSHGVELDGFLLEEMAPKGVEMVVGGINDPQFGPMVMVGLGGVFVEVFKDVAFRLCPVDRKGARAM